MLSVLHDGPKRIPSYATIMGVPEGVKHTGEIYFGSKYSGEDDVDKLRKSLPIARNVSSLARPYFCWLLRPC
jgi:hypothetical protein